MPHIEVKFAIDASGIREVTAIDTVRATTIVLPLQILPIYKYFPYRTRWLNQIQNITALSVRKCKWYFFVYYVLAYTNMHECVMVPVHCADFFLEDYILSRNALMSSKIVDSEANTAMILI